MKRRAFTKLVLAVAAPFAVLAASTFGPGASAEPRQRDWLMVVKSVNTDPGRDEAFNRWYNDVDIPDVLKVPGYMRARRGQRVDRDLGTGPTDASDGYVALYDIRSANLDKTIIAMLMASWRMDQLGRSTDLIKVVERIYYRRLAPSTGGVSNNDRHWLYLVRTDRPPQPALLRRLAAAHLFQRATPYMLDRVLMHEPRTVPEYLTVFEIAAASPETAKIAAETIGSALPNRDHGVYQLIRDEVRP